MTHDSQYLGIKPSTIHDVLMNQNSEHKSLLPHSGATFLSGRSGSSSPSRSGCRRTPPGRTSRSTRRAGRRAPPRPWPLRSPRHASRCPAGCCFRCSALNNPRMLLGEFVFVHQRAKDIENFVILCHFLICNCTL